MVLITPNIARYIGKKIYGLDFLDRYLCLDSPVEATHHRALVILVFLKHILKDAEVLHGSIYLHMHIDRIDGDTAFSSFILLWVADDLMTLYLAPGFLASSSYNTEPVVQQTPPATIRAPQLNSDFKFIWEEK